MAGEGSKNVFHKIGAVLRHFFGTHTVPPFFLAIRDFFAQGGGKRFFSRVLPPIGRFFVRYKSSFIASGIGIVVVGGALGGYFAWRAAQPQTRIESSEGSAKRSKPIEVSYSINTPHNDMEMGRGSPLVIEFYGSAAPIEQAGLPLENGPQLTPSIDGSWAWDGDNRLVFTPAQWWRPGENYKINLRKDLLAPHVTARYKADFSIQGFYLSVGSGEFHIDPENSKIKRVIATVTANYPLLPSSLEAATSIEPDIKMSDGALEKRPYVFTVKYDNDNRTAYIVSEPLGIPGDDVAMKIRVAEGVQTSLFEGGVASSDYTTVTVPGASRFARLEDISLNLVKNEDNVYEQVLMLSTRGKTTVRELENKLSAWVLPVHRPELPGLEADLYHHWNLDEMIDQVLDQSERISFKALPSESAWSELNSWRVEVPENRMIYVKLEAGARFWGDYYLSKPTEYILESPTFPRELSILSEGTLLALNGQKRLSLLTRGVSRINCSVARIMPRDLHHLVSQSNGSMRNFSFSSSRFNQYNIGVTTSETIHLEEADLRRPSYSSFDFSKHLVSKPSEALSSGIFLFTAQDAQTYSRRDQRLILVTDLGLAIKRANDGSSLAFVQSLSSGRPVSGARISLLARNGLELASATTAADGVVRFPKISSWSDEKTPVAWLVTRGDDLAFMPWSDSGRGIDWSGFEVGGLHGADDPDRVEAFLFSDRGLYRPGDEVRIGAIVKTGDWARSLAGMPLEYRIVDSKGAEFLTRRIPLSSEGFEEIRFRTQEWSPTGTWTVQVYLIDDVRKTRRDLGSQKVKIEEFLPDTLAITAYLEPQSISGWVHPGEFSAHVQVKNLFGTPASGNSVKAQIELDPGYRSFRQYREWRFNDPLIKGSSYQEFLGTETTEDDGTCNFHFDVGKFERASYRMRFYTEAFEKDSGRKVSSETSVYVSPLDYLVGWKADTSLSWIKRGAGGKIDFIAIDKDLKKVAVKDLVFTLNEKRWVSVLVRQNSGVYKYESVRRTELVKEETLAIAAEGLTWKIPSNAAGDFELVITGPDGLVYNRLEYSVADQKNTSRSLTRTAALDISLDKTDYRNGEGIQLMIKAPYAGSGLITIERDKVYTYKWFQATGTSSVQTIRVPGDLEGNGYVSVLFLRAADSPEVFMPPLSYATVPFSVSKESHMAKITLSFPDEAKPGSDFPITFSTQEPGKIILYAVDEGILQRAGYQLPDPIAHFFRKRALEVQTNQTLDLLLPEFNIVQSLAAMGGGGGYEDEALSRNLNPFKRRRDEPVAWWSGVVDSGPEARTLNYRIPGHFNGSLRIMAVAANSERVGAVSERALVRDDFIIMPNAPTQAAPGDEFQVAVTVTNLLEGSGPDARLVFTVEGDERLEVQGENTYTLQIPEGKDETVRLRVKATGKVGAAELSYRVSGGKALSKAASSLSVRPITPYRVSLFSGTTGRDASIPLERTLYTEFAKREATFSWLPLSLAGGLKFFLETYPYGCSEQVTSAVWPLLYPQLQREFSVTRAEIKASVSRVVDILQARQRSDGSLGIWTVRSWSHPFVDAYCAHFLTEARAQELYVPEAFFDRLLSALRRHASSDSVSNDHRAYAIYILTLNGERTGSLMESLKDSMRRDKWREDGLANLYLAGSHALLQQEKEALKLFWLIKLRNARDENWYYMDSLAFNSIYLTMISRHLPERLKDIQDELLMSMAQELEGQRFTSISANWALMGIDAFLKAAPPPAEAKISLSEVLADKSKRELALEGTAAWTAGFSADAKALAFKNREKLNIFFQVMVAGFDREAPQKAIANGIEVFRTFNDADGRALPGAQLGDEVWVTLTFHSLGASPIGDVALVDLLPSGLEADIDSIRNGEGEDGWTPDYIDIREDRLVVFGRVPEKATTWRYKTRAITTGNFITPPPFAEALYDKAIWALGTAGRFPIGEVDGK